MISSIIATRVMATALPNGQLRDCRNRSTRALPTKNTLPPPRMAGIRNSPMSRMNTSMLPVMTPGAESGRVTRRKVSKAPAPRSDEASSRRLSSFSRLT
ncbi:hypothetical protein D9M72_307090 [compost metagenome]